MKEPDYVMKLMTTYGSLIPKVGHKQARRSFKKNGSLVTESFDYTEPYANHFLYRHAVDDHKNLRHRLPAIEDIWLTSRWANRVFSFLLAITEVNIFFLRTASLSGQSAESSRHQNC